jgi:hypothetical protein
MMQRLGSEKKSKFIRAEFLPIIIVIFILLLVLSLALFSNANAYYGLSGLGLYGSGIYGGLGFYGLGGGYGMGLYGLSGLYGGIGGLYGIGGFYGLGGMFGGLGGLYGISGLYSSGVLGGLYGLSGLCGLCGGLYGIGCSYGLNGMYGGLGGFGGLLSSIGQLSSLGLLGIGTQSKAQPAPVMTAEQAGTWTGTWFSLVQLKGGLMNMTLVEDALTGIISGEVNLILNKITNSIPANVTGVLTAGGGTTTFILTGGNQGFLGNTLTTLLLLPSSIPIYNIELTCTMTSPVNMTGTYQIQNLLKLEVDYGDFDLVLTTPVI